MHEQVIRLLQSIRQDAAEIESCACFIILCKDITDEASKHKVGEHVRDLQKMSKRLRRCAQGL